MLVYENTLISMTPQSNFTIIAPIVPERMPVLKDLLNQMNVRPGTNTCLGMADPHNDVIPFGQFAKLHTARFVILDDQTLGDFERVGEQVPNYGPLKLAFMGDCDGCADDVLADMAQRANKGLRDVFSNCECFDVRTDLLTWINKHRQRAAAAYVNHIGRTVCQIRHEHALRTELVGFLKEHSAPDADPQTTRNMLIKHARAKNFIPAAAEEPTPLAWCVRNFFHLITLPAILAIFIFALWIALRSAAGVAYPVALIGVAWGLLAVVLAVVLIFFLALRWYETTEPEIDVRPTDQYTEMLARDEDHDLVNQFSIVGSVRPTAFRRRMLIVNLWVIDWFARHIYGRGYLARIRSIHFARWVFMDDKNRVLFASTYDGSLESYNDDFINKGGFGLNFAFGGAVGYPRCRWVILEGAKREQKFKYILRRHQLPTQVWYNAYPGLTVYDLARNTRVCEGIERPTMSNKDIRRWLTDL